MAGAPVADFRYYDALYSERYMDYTGENDEVSQPHWANTSMIRIVENCKIF